MTMKNDFVNRHIGPNSNEIKIMLNALQFTSLDELINLTIPKENRLSTDLPISSPLTEVDCLSYLKSKISDNKLYKSYIGQGYYGTITPSVIQRNIFENPSWYTQYTPYQAEISQGRLEALLNFQTVITELTGMPIANASLLDESTAAAEAMTLLFRASKNSQASTFLVDHDIFEQTKSVLTTRAKYLGITVQYVDLNQVQFSNDIFGVLFQYPNAYGAVNTPNHWIDQAKSFTYTG